MNRRFAACVLSFLVLFPIFSEGNRSSSLKPLEFEETWGYVSMNRKDEYSDDLPLTDVLYFSADVNCYGELISVPDIDAINVTGKRRHLVFICDSKSLTHFVLSPEYPVRRNIIRQIVEAAEPFDGVNVDLELVPARDREIYLSFLAELGANLEGKMYSVCVPARVRKFQEEVFPYAEIARLCDRVFIMAYDEHWSGSVPGPVASQEWCKNVLTFAKKQIPHKKIVMGIPFYSRTWQDKNDATAWYYKSITRKMEENDVSEVEYKNGIPVFTYTTEAKVTGYISDATTVYNLAEMYRKGGVNKVGYWRIGQEDPEVWNLILPKD